MAGTTLTQAEVRSIASNTLRSELFTRVHAEYERFRAEHGISQPMYAQVAIPTQVTDSQTDAAVDEFIDEYPEAKSQDEVIEAIKDYINENYDEDFLYNEVEHAYDEDVVAETALDELLLILENTEPYQDVERSYWRRQAQGGGIGTYDYVRFATQDGVDQFVEEYAPDWKSEANI